MLSEEERKAIQMLDKFITEHKLFNIKQSDGLEENIRIILNLIEKLQKENEELKQENKRIKYFSSNLFIGDYIPKIEIKDLMEKLNKEIRNCDTIEAVFKIKQQQILQELLEGDKNG